MSPARRELIETLLELSAAWPEVRFGQLVANLATLAGGSSPGDMWDMEDDVLLAAAKQQLEHFAPEALAAAAS